jgi:hypothetical protein
VIAVHWSVKWFNHHLTQSLSKEAAIYLEKLANLQDAELGCAQLWSQAQRILGTVHSEIMCTGDSCGCQFYRRKKVQADIRVALEAVDKCGRWEWVCTKGFY